MRTQVALSVMKLMDGLKAFVTGGATKRAAGAEAMLAHIPSSLHKDFGFAGTDFDKSMIMQGAVVGIVDMVGSTTISNAVDMLTEFSFKREFQRLASVRANENGIVILNHTGDGFVFLANYSQKNEWQTRLLRFHESLTTDFRALLLSLQEQTGKRFLSGLRCGIAQGNIILGFLSSNPAHFTAVGSVVNLAARICAVASNDEIVFSAEAWKQMQGSVAGFSSRRYQQELKGFEGTVATIHMRTQCAEMERSQGFAAGIVAPVAA